MTNCKEFLTFKTFFASYGEYHANPMQAWLKIHSNKGIHMIFIPILMATFIGMLNTIAPFSTVHTQFGIDLPINYSSIILLLLVLWYIVIDPISGIVSGLFYTGAFFVMLHLQAHWTYSFSFLQFCAGVNIASWIAQFVGHFVYEKRAPALMDNLFLTLVAPDFAILEWLALLGYKENEIGEAMDLIHERIRLFHAAKND